MMSTRKGRPHPLGATWDGSGVNFALYSEHAQRVELCIFSSVTARKESQRIPLTNKTEHVWHTYLPDVNPGTLYGYRVYGPYQPDVGLRFNPYKVLVDPYARSVLRLNHFGDQLFGYRFGHSDTTMDKRDNAPHAPLSVVTDPSFTWGNDQPPNTPWNETVLYETHVKGMTFQHPDVAPNLRGTFAGLASEPVLRHLTQLGVTAVQLMPVHQHFGERHLFDRGLKNYWGYNTLSYFAPDQRFSSQTMGDVTHEFKMMVRTLHMAGIEVILDVVYNHTAEGNHLGPTLSMRGIDNPVYYRLSPTELRFYEDVTGCGNTLNVTHPRVLQLIADSLRYWVTEMHVDGFRFDLAASLIRDTHGVDLQHAFLKIIQQDPVLSRVKLIAEPWDLGDGGYQVGKFPPPWSELNDQYRDTVRRYWKGDEGMIPSMASRLTGSSDLYEHNHRTPQASINLLTSHDGFTLQDLVSYNKKHNEANGENNRDGSDANHSWNCGIEGKTGNQKIRALRARQKRNLMATLFISQGVPLISAGDELGRTQQGNNNPYCQDNPIVWFNWNLDREQKHFLEFVRWLIRLRKEHPVLRRKKFFQGKRVTGSKTKDISWISATGREKTQAEWNTPFARCFGMRLAGDGINDVDDQGKRIEGDTLLILMNAYHEAIPFTLPAHRKGTRWTLILDTSRSEPVPPENMARGGRDFPLGPRCLAIFRLDRGSK